MDPSLTVSISPHLRSGETTKKVMWSMALALAPAGIAGVVIFGMHALWVIVSSVAAALLTEASVQALRKREITIADGSALITGILLSYNIPPGVPLWLPAAGSFFAIAIGKQAFGGLGHNIFNPALAGRAFLMISWPVFMTTWQKPQWQPDALSGASPLGVLKEAGAAGLAAKFPELGLVDLLLGNRPGCIGEVCVIVLLAGACYLYVRRIISLHAPAAFIGTVAFFSWAFCGYNGLFSGDAVFFVLNGGLILGAFFMATDYVTTPLTGRGRVVFGLGCGILTFLIRKFSGYPEGVSYSILMMNAATPLIDRYTRPRWFGYTKAKS